MEGSGFSEESPLDTMLVQEISEATGFTPTESSSFDTHESLSPEYLQRKLYFLLEHLKKMHSELPE